MSASEPGTVEHTLRIHARPETVWGYWTDPKRMCEWWAIAADLDPRPGGVCHVETEEGGLMRGEYVELVPHERIVFTFGWVPTKGAPAVPPGSSRVEVTLAEDRGDTVMTVRHTGLPAGEAAKHRSGWAHFLGRLAAANGTRER